MKESNIANLADTMMMGKENIQALEKNKDLVFVYLAQSTNAGLKDKYPASLAISFNIRDEDLHTRFQEYLKSRHAGGVLHLDSVNKGPMKVSYAIDFSDSSIIKEIFHKFFKKKKLTQYSVAQTSEDLSVENLLLKAKAIVLG